MSTNIANLGEVIHQFDGTEFVPHPLDRKILGGVALINLVESVDIVKVTDRVKDIFTELGKDRSSEFGACVAYALGIPDVDRSKIEDVIIDSATKISDGELDRHEDDISGGSIWTGLYRSKPFYLSNRSIPIVLSDGTLPVGDVFTIVGLPSEQ